MAVTLVEELAAKLNAHQQSHQKSLRKALIGCIVARLVFYAFDFAFGLFYLNRQQDKCEHIFEAERVFKPLEFNKAGQECWCDYHEDGPGLADRPLRNYWHLTLTMYAGNWLHATMVLCVMLSANRDWLKNVVYTLLVILSLVYDPVIAIGVYGIVILTPQLSNGIRKDRAPRPY